MGKKIGQGGMGRRGSQEESGQPFPGPRGGQKGGEDRAGQADRGGERQDEGRHTVKQELRATERQWGGRDWPGEKGIQTDERTDLGRNRKLEGGQGGSEEQKEIQRKRSEMTQKVKEGEGLRQGRGSGNRRGPGQRGQRGLPSQGRTPRPAPAHYKLLI